MLQVSICVPCYNESLVLDRTHRELTEVLRKLEPELCYEIIFVDNGGTDGQLDVMRRLHASDPAHVRVVSLSRNFGYQMSMSAGLAHARGDAVVLIDADLQDPPEMILDFVKKWREGYDVVFGVRTRRQGSLFMRSMYHTFYRILNRTSDIPITPNAGEFGLMTRRVVDIINDLPERVRFIRGLRAWAGFKQFSIPYTRRIRKQGKSKFRFLDATSLAMDGIFSFSTRVMTLVAIIGFVASLASFLLMTYIIVWKLTAEQEIPGYAAIMVAISFFSGMTSFMLGVIGGIAERIFVEVKTRPRFVVMETLGFTNGRTPTSIEGGSRSGSRSFLPQRDVERASPRPAEAET
jgi:dolichol-phosphate mannosyltransferase